MISHNRRAPACLHSVQRARNPCISSLTGKTEALLVVYPSADFVDKNGAKPGETQVGVNEKYRRLVAHLHKEKGGK
ncbi:MULTISPECIES: hypothetical protein [Burkholderia]|uniref:hypothetical protein n=1 Tax=Burkholderia TaxID=32008 RepID=UPI0011786CB4|nr:MULTISPECIES: hypothetical protein [Burkholderia]MDF3097643.1 hypothetical protein [Burkholderia semiarida]MEB2535061.1 hypothetical protein [Burkholderia anthinoferrum]